MKKKIIVSSVILGVLIFVSIIGLYLYNRNMNYKITITEKFWGEDGVQYHNKEITLNIKLNDEIKVNNGVGGELTFEVIKVNKDYITIKTSEEMSCKTVDLLSQDDEFIIKKNEETKLNRLVTDVGFSYTLLLE